MKTVHTLFPSLASLLPLLLLIAIYIRVGNVRRNDNNGLICWSMMTCITGMMNNKLSDENHASGNTTTTSLPFSFSFFCSCWLLYMMVLVRRMDRVCVCWWWCVYCIAGAMNYELSNGYDTTRIMYIGCDELLYALSNGNPTNDNATTAPSSSLSVDAVTVDRIPSHPIPSDPTRSNPIQSNPTQSNPI